MTSVEKRRSGRKSGGHRKHSDGGYSDTSSGGSFLDETDREVSNLTDRAFRSLCIGDEAVYNDSDLCSSSPCTQRDRQLAFSHSSQDRDGEDREREELKRAAHDSFSLRMQQYGQEWIHGGMYGAEIHRDPQWGVYRERTQGRVSATFQRSFMEMSQQEKSLNEEQLSFFSNGATELSSQQRRSRSRVSSLIRAFNSEGQRDGAGMDGKLRDCNDETSWDKSALMSIQRELSEFSTSYQQNFDSGHFPPAGPFSSRDNFYSSEVAAVAHMNAASSFMRSSHSKHSMLTQVNCNSNFFIHSEFSPFRVWRDHNRFPFQQGEVSGFMHCSEFPKWCKTPMYKELSLEAQPQGPSMFEERGIRHQRNTLAPMVPPTPSRSTSASTMLQKASSVEKRCESELAGHYPQRTRTQSLGSNRLPSQRPSTASPTIEMSRRVRDTISSVKALQQKIKMMTEQNIAAEVTANKEEVLYSNNSLIPIGNNAVTAAPKVHALQETSEVQQCAVPPQPVEHPPVRAGSRGATPDVRMSSYKSKATSLLFNLKDNRKRVKSTYSPTKFKGLETLEKNKQPAVQEHRDIVIDIPEFPDPDIQIPQVDVSNWTDEASHHHANQYQRPGQSLTTMHSQPATVYTGQNLEYISSEYQAAQMQGEMVHHSGFTSYIPENDSSNQLPNGQNLHEDLSSFTPYKQSMIENIETLGGDVSRHKPSYRATEIPRLNAENNQIREYVIGKGNTQQHFNEAVGREYTKVDRYQQLKENKHDYSNVSSQDRWRQTNNQDTEKLSLNAATSPWKQDISALMEKDQHAQDYQKTATIKEELSSPRDKHIRENTQSINKELKQIPQNPAYHGQQQHGAFKDKSTLQKYHGQNVENEVKENYLTPNYSYNDHEHRNKHTFYSDEEKTVFMQETSQKKQYSPMLKDQSLQSKEGKQLFEHNMQKNSLSVPDKALAPTAANQVKNRQFVEVKAAEDAAEQIKAVCTQAELEKAQHWAQVEQPKTEQAKVILACQTSLEKVKEELTEQDSIKQAKAEFNVADKAQVEHNEEEQRRKKQSGGKKPEQAREEHLKEEQTRVQNVTEVPRNVTEEAGAEHTRQEQSERVKAEQADAERLKEEHIKTELAKSKQPVQARTEQAKTQLAQQERIKSEQLEMEAEQVKVKAELAEEEHRKTEQVQLQQMKLQQANAGQEETKAVGGNVKAEHNVEKVREKKAEEDSVEADQVNAEQPKTETGKAKEANIKQTKLEQTKVELAKELIKTQKIQEWSAKSTAKITMAQKVKSEPSRVEQVKTELAKAKAELAKIKEKMKGEQKEKIMSTVITKEDDTAKKDVSLRADINENEEQVPATKINQQKQDSVVSRNSKDGGADDYQSLREKYGLTNAVSTHRNKESPARKVSSNDDSVTSALALDKVETLNNKTSKDEYNPTSKLATPKTENKENVGNIQSNEVTESNYIYTESSKEFKLSSVNYSPTGVDKRTKSDTVTDKVKDGVDRLGKGEPVKQADVSQQRSGLVKPLERKPRSSDHSVFSGVTPPKALFHKERAQTKQEILTSKIKAHAEKEISAIKEKGFALPDGFTSKNSTKHLLGSQSINIRQRPPSQEVSRRHESTMPNNTTPKHQMGTAGIQVEPVKSISLSSTAATTSQILDVLQKHVPNETIKSIDTVPEAQPAGSTDGGLIENQKKEDQSGIKSPTQNKDGALDNKEKQEVKHEENSEGLMSKISINTEQLNKKKEDPSQATSKHEVTPEDSSPAVKLVFGQNETSVADDSLQIMGIMVTVRERMGNGPADVSTQKQTHAKDHSNAKPDKCHHSLGVEVNKENESSAGVSTGEAKDRVAQESHPTVNEDKVGMNNHPENMQETSTRTNNVTEKRTTPQQESYIHARPQREIQLQEPLTENEAPPMVTVPAKNKVLAETQPCFYKQNIITREKKDHTNETPRQNSANIMTKDQEGINTEEKNPQTTLTDDVNETFKAKLVNTGIDYKDDFNRVDAETRIKPDAQPSVKNDMTTVINPSKSSKIDDKSAPLVEEKRHDSTRLKSFSKTSPSSQLDENEIRHVPSKHQHKETHIKESNKVDSDVHIDSIAIRVVPAVIEKDNLEVMGKQITAVPSDAVAANEHKQVESSSPDETVSTVNKEDESKDSTATNSEEQMKDNLEGKLGVQYVLTSVRKLADSLKISNHQSSKKATSEIEQKNGTTSNTQPVEGDYFQVQGVIETNDEPYNSTNVRDRSDAVSKRGELPGLPNMTAISNESYKKGKHEVFALDQSKSKTVEPCPVSIQNENIKKDNREIEDKNASKPTNYPTETQSSKCENMDTGQAIPIRTHYPERKKRNSQPTRENAAKEKPEVQPKPKERVSTIPEISALADYARLKVIVSQETANMMQEFPPSKKEGFFPLIQSRHSRRPVFTADPQDLSMKEKSLSNKTEVSPKVIKEPKPVVFPITEKEHQRTGMFKLGDKERQEKILSDVKDNDSVLETVAKHAQDLAERKKSPQEHIRNEGNREEIAGAGTQRVNQVDQNVHQPNNHPMQTTTSSSSVNKPRNTVLQHLKPCEKTEFSSADGMTNLDRDSQIYSMKESKTNLRKGENNEDKDTVAGEDRTDKPRQESLTIPYKETGVKPQSRAKQLDEALGTDEKKREELRIKNIIEESRASLAEEERRAAQREVERRARERETIAIKIKERREKQKEAERRAEEERKAKQAEEERAAQKEEEGRRARQREEEMKMKQFEEKRRAKIEEERKAKLRVEEERMKVIEERRRVKQREEERAALIEEQRRAKQVEEEKRLAHIEEERKRKKSEEERAAQEEQQRRAALIEEQWRKAKQVEEERRLAYIEEERKRKSSEEKAAQITEEKMIKQIQEQRRERQKKEWLRTQTEEERRSVDKEKAIVKQKEEQQAKEERARLLEEASQAAQREEKRIAQEQLQAQREEEIRAKKREEAKIAAQREQERASRVEEQKRAAQRMDALQYYAITSTESERKPRERQLPSPIPCQQRNNTSESTADFGSYSRSHRPHAPASPAPSLPRSNTSSPALGAKPLMFRVKDNTIRGSSFTKSVKPRFHKNFGEDFRVGSPMERGDEEQEIVRRNTGTPIHPDTATRHTAIKESSNLQPTSSSQDYSVPLPHHRPYSRRSIILDEDESRSVFSNMSEDVESFVTSTTDLADVRGLYDYERPESACSFSSELSRLGKPPVVPPKSEKALLRAKRLTTRRIKKELSKAGADIPAKKSLKEVSSIPSSSSSEVCSSNRHAVASPHFSPPVSLTNAPLRSSLLSSQAEQQPPHRSFHGSPHATTPVSLPFASPHATGPVSLPVASPHATGPVSFPVASPHATDPVSFPVASPHATGPVSFPVASPHATTPVSLPVASPHATGPVSFPVASPHATGSVSLPVASPHATGPVSLPVASPHATGPVSFPVASPHATGPVSFPVASPHATDPVSFPVASPHATGPVSFPVASPHATGPVSFPVASPHATGPVSFPVASPHATGSVSLPVASPHATGPVSFPVASPHATGPVSLPVASPHATGPVSLPVASPHVTGPVSHSIAPKTVAHVPSSPTLHHANHPAPVTQYHVESSYPQSYPLTQRKVLQDLGSGQYFVVDVPVQVKTKTFFDPETGKYVQLNVRESGQSTTQPQSQQTYPQPQLQPQMQVKQQQQPLSQSSPAGKPFVVYQGYHGYPQSAGISSVHPQSSSSGMSAPMTPSQDQLPGGHRYSPEKTPYMDTVNDKDKTHNTGYNTHGLYECDSQLAGSLVCDNNSSAHSRYQSRDIITMGDLEDFMEVSDW